MLAAVQILQPFYTPTTNDLLRQAFQAEKFAQELCAQAATDPTNRYAAAEAKNWAYQAAALRQQIAHA